MAYMWQLRVTCNASGCFEGDKDIATGPSPDQMRVSEWSKKELAGWVLIDNKHYCPKHRDYPTKLAAKIGEMIER